MAMTTSPGTVDTPGPTAALPSPFPSRIRTVGVLAPAGIPQPERLARGLARLHDWGLTVVTPTTDTPPDRYLAAPDAARVAQFHELLHDPRVDVVMMARGGFGCARILDDLDWGLLQRRALPIVGYSDVTALHLGALRAGATTGISGPMVAIELGGPLISAQHLNALALTLQSFADVWTPGRAVCLPPGTALTPLRPGSAVGPIVPANLSVLVSLLGTRHMPRLRDAILVLEDTHEAAYRIDRYLTQLRQAGVLAQLAGLLFGSFSEGEDAEWLPAIMAEFAARVPGPVASGLPLGHCSPSLAAPVGRTGRLVCTNEHVEQLYW